MEMPKMEIKANDDMRAVLRMHHDFAAAELRQNILLGDVLAGKLPALSKFHGFTGWIRRIEDDTPFPQGNTIKEHQ